MQDSQGAMLIVVLFISLIIFLVCREVTCWYFKINELNRKIDTTNKLLADIRDLAATPRVSVAPAVTPVAPNGARWPIAKGISPAKPGNVP